MTGIIEHVEPLLAVTEAVENFIPLIFVFFSVCGTFNISRDP